MVFSNNITSEALEDLILVFNLFDTNRNGFISKATFKDVLELLDEEDVPEMTSVDTYMGPEKDCINLKDFMNFFADVLLHGNGGTTSSSDSSSSSLDCPSHPLDPFDVLYEASRSPGDDQEDVPTVAPRQLRYGLESFAQYITQAEAEAMTKYQNPRPAHKKLTRSQYRAIVKQYEARREEELRRP